MARLTASQRAKLPDRAFAYVDAKGRRRLPIHDEAHVRNALARFERVAFEDDASRERARKRLLTAAKKFKLMPVGFIAGQLRTEKAARASATASLPRGVVTFLMSDIEGSTRLLRSLGSAYSSLLSEVRRIHRREVRAAGGHEVDARADEYFASFEQPAAAIEAAVAIQRRLGERRAWREGLVRVRMGLHLGEPALTEEGYVDLSVHAVARICRVGSGGEVLVSKDVRDQLAGVRPASVRLSSIGAHRLPGLPDPITLFRVRAKGLAETAPSRARGRVAARNRGRRGRSSARAD
ncbi:MAG: adenylate/guanylate cyclase domain-containing protein [Deltaproteobacteria bacterium]|nr:adenylate/guanylate cyclase domain-containing protein [Deltaproteobacteria bacterium]